MVDEKIIQAVKKTIDGDPAKDCVKSVSIFGSVGRGRGRPESDIDLLLEMKKTMSLFQILAMKKNLEEELGRKVDLVDRDSLIESLRDSIIAEAQTIYERQ